MQSQEKGGVVSLPFAEHWFPPRAELLETYRERTLKGFSRLSRSKAVICGLARDLGPVAQLTLNRIEKLGSLFASYKVILVENDSTDGTQQTLRSWSALNDQSILFTSNIGVERFGATRERKRTDTLASLRELYRTFICEYLNSYDYVLILDTDLEGGWSLHGIANTFGWDQWDVVASNGIKYYELPKRGCLNLYKQVQYDAWAYRKKGCFGAHPNKLINRISFERGDSLVPVASAFGGLAIYRMKAFLSSKYTGDDCEHVPFHVGMASNGHSRIFVNPSQIALYNVPPRNTIVVAGPFLKEEAIVAQL